MWEMGEKYSTKLLFFSFGSPWRTQWPTANAMSTKWWTWLVEGSWRTSCPCGKHHALHTLICLLSLQGRWRLMGAMSRRMPWRSPPVYFLHLSPFLSIFAPFSLVPTPTWKLPETRTNYQHNTT